MEINFPTDVVNFLEKPSYEKAQDYLNSGNYLWNSGMFIFYYITIMDELRRYVPNHINIIELMRDDIFKYSGIMLANKTQRLFELFERISIDYAVMEKSIIIKCIPVDIGWNDVGGYNSFENLLPKDNNGNISKNAKYVYIDSKNNIVISVNKNKLITTIGIENTVIVDSANGILVCNRDNAQRIKELLTLL